MKRKYQYLDSLDETHVSMIIRAFLAFPAKPGVIWDVGSAAGKVLIESKLRYKDVKLVAIESNPEYEALMRANQKTHGVAEDAIDFVLRDAVDGDLSDLPKPDAIYFSFAGAAKEDILPKLFGLLNPGGVIVCNVSQYADYDHEKIKRSVERLKAAQAAFGGVLEDYLYYSSRGGNKKRFWSHDVLHWTGGKPV